MSVFDLDQPSHERIETDLDFRGGHIPIPFTAKRAMITQDSSIEVTGLSPGAIFETIAGFTDAASGETKQQVVPLRIPHSVIVEPLLQVGKGDETAITPSPDAHHNLVISPFGPDTAFSHLFARNISLQRLKSEIKATPSGEQPNEFAITEVVKTLDDELAGLDRVIVASDGGVVSHDQNSPSSTRPIVARSVELDENAGSVKIVLRGERVPETRQNPKGVQLAAQLVVNHEIEDADLILGSAEFGALHEKLGRDGKPHADHTRTSIVFKGPNEAEVARNQARKVPFVGIRVCVSSANELTVRDSGTEIRTSVANEIVPADLRPSTTPMENNGLTALTPGGIDPSSIDLSAFSDTAGDDDASTGTDGYGRPYSDLLDGRRSS